jgi:PIN domain nuclease of toxin-antitoxin system
VSRGRYLLDSHILIWLDKGSDRLKPHVLERLRFAEQRYLSAATAWELSLKQAAGKLTLQKPIGAMLEVFNLVELPVTIRHGDEAALLPMHHGDPFDRMLVAQALAEGLILVTADEELAQYGVPILLV